MEPGGELIDDVVELEVAHPEIVHKEHGRGPLVAGLEHAHPHAAGGHVAAPALDGCFLLHGRQAYRLRGGPRRPIEPSPRPRLTPPE
jgi:hypothetical protein